MAHGGDRIMNYFIWFYYEFYNNLIIINREKGEREKVIERG